ncbi:MAG: hypothetical protein C4541_09870 [Candidatus Auribacter fodinae]|uniref:V-type ATP synthase subunit C n=1 Tax=Candidatus Auribacter fodinae TaxID=2093366 RepID=A0A3A4QUE1_9BACT|nr:MAG: hypothetical protein C4541_09870 [Candidatus Auribacter fodinae]
MKDLHRYAHINARVRVMLGSLLTPDMWQKLYSAYSIESLMNQLAETRYEPWVHDTPPEEFINAIDTHIVETSLSAEKHIHKLLIGLPADIIATFTELYDIEHIKRGLRAWHGKYSFNPPALTQYSQRYPIDWSIFTKSGTTLEDIIVQMMGIPYGKALANARDRFNKSKTLFYLETALEKDLFTRICEQIGQLSGTDRKGVQQLLGVYVDSLNIKNIIRSKLYFNIPPNTIDTALYPGGAQFKQDQCFDLYVSKDNRDLLQKLAVRPFDSIGRFIQKGSLDEAAVLLDALLQQALYRQIRKILGGYPFTLAVVLSYITLNRWELNSLRSLVWLLYLNKKERIDELKSANPMAVIKEQA